jgi:hypothetical protein
MPTLLRLRGHRFFFFSNERGEPPHIHTQSGENYAKFWLNPVVLAQSVGYNAREIRALQQIVVEHRETLERAWHDFFYNP